MKTTMIKGLMLSLLFLTACQGDNTPPVLPTAMVPDASAGVTSSAATPVEVPENKPVSTSSSEDTVASISPLFDVDWNDRTLFSRGLITSQQRMLDQLPGATVYHLDFEISDDLLRVTGQEEVHYTNREDTSLAEVYFRLFPNIAGGKAVVSAVTVAGQPVEPVIEFADTAARIPLPQPLPPGESVDVRLNFAVDVAQEMAGNYGLFGYYDGILVLDQFYPTIPVYDDEGWNVETPPPNADLSYNDASFYLVRVSAPDDLTMLTSGIEVNRETDGSRQTVTFAAGPARDFYLAAGDNYTVTSETVGETTINSYALPEYTVHSELALQVAVDSLRSFNERFGLYPYTEFDVLSTPMQALGIEYPGLVGVSLALYDPAEEIAGLPSRVLLESTVAHEVAHQWFYNTIGNDQVDEPWLDEALAQYVTWLYYVDVYGPGAAQGYVDSWKSRWNRVDQADIPIGLPAGEYDGREYGAIVYGRGPLFIAALAEEMGQESFDEFLRDYAETYQWKIATGELFKKLAEEHCQCDLTSLFEEWVYER